MLLGIGTASAADKKPNILVIMGDDVGITNISAYSHGLMGYQTPNIDRVAEEGAMFTDYYGEQSCTAGRSTFITGQSPFRVGLTKVGMPGAKSDISDKDPTLAELLKPLGYTSGQFGNAKLPAPKWSAPVVPPDWSGYLTCGPSTDMWLARLHEPP